jgi:hypothetical protein
MIASQHCALPETALLRRYQDRGAYTDCFSYDVSGAVTLADYITAFYTSAAFRPERFILGMLLHIQSTDEDVGKLANATIERFAAWTVEARDRHQILLCDYQSRTRSWLMVESINGDRAGARTRLYFGTAVTQIDKTPARRAFASFVFWALLWFHKIYSRILIGMAGRRVSYIHRS